jgi:hypothetical protein
LPALASSAMAFVSPAFSVIRVSLAVSPGACTVITCSPGSTGIGTPSAFSATTTPSRVTTVPFGALGASTSVISATLGLSLARAARTVGR